MGVMNATDMYGSPHGHEQHAESTEKDFDKKEQLLSVLEAHHLHHLDHTTRRRATHQGYAAHMHPKVLDYAFGTEKLRKQMLRTEVDTTAVLATSHQPLDTELSTTTAPTTTTSRQRRRRWHGQVRRRWQEQDPGQLDAPDEVDILETLAYDAPQSCESRGKTDRRKTTDTL